MLELKKITKTYVTSNERVEALKGIDLKFRKKEFVSILGPSGCGKTTLLNIIGGLDRYTSGDLIINGKSTKSFKDRDWDSYRNYSVGFIFQNYNLIGHQNVLSNVELALTISGVSKSERKKRAIKALEQVGLKDQIHKKPNELSGGQMQRVAIARALVNNPDIILADEPTGALDTKTSIQVMDILKEISKEKLVIMVTHNSELAEKYSTRIIKILDGKKISDTNPLTKKEEKEETYTYGKTSMKFLTALQLSLNNLLTKKGRTILTAFAGSIGIIGIALILAISTGVKGYIDKVEEDSVSSYPITIEKSTIDINSMMQSMIKETTKTKERKEEKVYSANVMNQMMSILSNQVKTNNLTNLKEYIENKDKTIKENSNAITYSYNLDINLYKSDTSNGIVKTNPSTVMETMGMGNIAEIEKSSMMQGMSTASNDVWIEMLDNEELLKSQYDLLKGDWPNKYNEVVLIIGKDNEISDYALYSLGLKDQKELKEQMDKISKGEKIKEQEETSYTYDELLNLRYKLILNSDYYTKENGMWIDNSKNEDYMKKKIEEAQEIKVVGIIRQKEDTVAMDMTGGIGYTKDLKEYVIEQSNNTEIVKEQIANPNINVFSKLEFPKEGEDKSFNFSELPEETKIMLNNLSSEELAKIIETYNNNANTTYESNLEKLGAINLNNPSRISIYPKDFEGKDAITNAIEVYNNKEKANGNEENAITYTDLVGVMIKSVSQIVNMISYVLITFVAVSLIVSSIMIGIITYISVLERTKEIGILRAIGVSKKDVSRIFKAETLIIGLIAGILGILVTIIITLPINYLIYALAGVKLVTRVPFVAGVILVLISVLLTTLGGLIPSKIASKKDPVVALRTE